MRNHLPLTPEETAWRARHVALTLRLRPDPAAAGLSALSYHEHGEDRSSYQACGSDAGKSFLIAKATEGVTYVDPEFACNRAYAHDHGLPFGIYHFSHPAQHAPEAEFSHLMATVKAFRPNEWLLHDCEVSWSKAWNLRFGQLADGVVARNGLYSYAGMIAANDTSGLPGTIDFVHPAAYGSTLPGGDRWGTALFWQHTNGENGTVDAPCDCSALTGFGTGGTVDQLVAYLGGAPPPPPPAWKQLADTSVYYQ